MGWAEFEKARNEYNNEFKRIDEQIIRLLTERKAAQKVLFHK